MEIFDYNLNMINEIFQAQLVQITGNGAYWVRRVGADPHYAPAFAEMRAQLLTSFPNTDGTNEQRLPSTLVNAYCICARIDLNVYILGFLPAVTSKQLLKPQPGEFVSQHPSGTFTQITAEGKYILFTDLFSTIVLDPVSQSIYSQFKNVIHRLWAGYLTSQVDDNDFQLLKIYLARKLDTSALPDSTQPPQDNLILQIGNITGQTHLVDFILSQGYSAKGADPNLSLHTTLGQNSNDSPQSMLGIGIQNKTDNATSQLILGTKAELKWTSSSNNTITLTLDPNSSDTVKVNVNGTDNVTITDKGNIVINGGTVTLNSVQPGTTKGFAYPLCFMTGAIHSDPTAGQTSGT